MPPASPSIWVIIPTYNERENVGPIVDAVLGQFRRRTSSSSMTGLRTARELADDMAAANKAIAVLHRPAKQGWAGPTWPRSRISWPATPTSWSR